MLQRCVTPCGIHNTESFDEFLRTGVKSVIEDVFKIDDVIMPTNMTYGGRQVDRLIYTMHFTNVNVEPPKRHDGMPMTPQDARVTKSTYASAITLTTETNIDIIFKDGGEKATLKVDTRKTPIGEFPLMVKSSLCTMRNVSRRDQYLIHNCDPNDNGGYFIIDGVEWFIEAQENVGVNAIRLFKADRKEEATRAEIISKPGDAFENSKQLILRVMNNGSIMMLIVGGKDRVDIPIQLYLRVLGIKTDTDIINMVTALEEDPDVANMIIESLRDNARQTIKSSEFGTIYKANDDITTAIELSKMTHKTSTSTAAMLMDDSRAVQYKTFMDFVDTNLLPHIGMDGSEETRFNKALYVCLIMVRMLRVHYLIDQPIDRDALGNKRIFASGYCYSRQLKMTIHSTIITSIRNVMRKTIEESSSLEHVSIPNIVVSAIQKARPGLVAGITNAITTGETDLVISMNSARKTTTRSRINSQTANRRNALNMWALSNVIHSPNTMAKATLTERSNEMRRVSPTFPGFVCVASTPSTGSIVGLTKQLAITARITPASMGAMLIDAVKPLVTTINMDNYREAIYGTSLVFVNGVLVGTSRDHYALAEKIRKMRRSNVIDRMVTVQATDTDLYMWTDLGRVVRPLIVVENGKTQLAEYLEKGTDFPTFQSMLETGAIEFISAEEQPNCFIAESYQVFRDLDKNIHQFTHIEIEGAIFSMVAHASAFANHTQPIRVSYHTNQGRQAGAPQPCADRMFLSKHFDQSHTQMPIVTTVTNHECTPSGENLIVAVLGFNGFNQEDSTVISDMAIANGMFAGYLRSAYHVSLTNYTQEEITPFSVDDPTIEQNSAKAMLKRDGLDEFGIIRIGSLITDNTVLVSKLNRINDDTTGVKYRDTSEVYRGADSYVDGVEVQYIQLVDTKGQEHRRISSVLVRLRKFCKLVHGDKLSTRSGNKNIVSQIMPNYLLPYYARDGTVPHMFVNPHSIPTRMVIGQLIEGALSQLGSLNNNFYDGTAFTSVDLETIRDDLKNKYHIEDFGMEKMINGETGEEIDALVFSVPVFIQRLQKFATEEFYVAGSGQRDPNTGQAREGRSRNGGLRSGEMEKDTISASGCMAALDSIFYKNSDGCRMAVCSTCGNLAMFSQNANAPFCNYCSSDSGVKIVEFAHISNLFTHYLGTAGVHMRMNVE